MHMDAGGELKMRMLETVSDCMLVDGVSDEGKLEKQETFFRDWGKANMVYITQGAYKIGEKWCHGAWAYFAPNILIYSQINRDTRTEILNSDVPVWSVLQKPYITSGDFQHSYIFGRAS